MDKNYSQIFIIWDKLFGTFQPELDNEPPVYGVTRAVHTWNPWLINYQHLWLLIKDAWWTSSWKDKLRIWFMPTGWRPADVSAKYPVTYSQDIYHRPKYETKATFLFKVWSAAQLVITMLLMMYLFNNIGEIPFSQVLFYGIFLFVSIFAYTSLMDGNIIGIAGEVVKMGIGLFLLYINGFQWFGIDSMIPNGTLIVLSYMMISLLSALYFYFADRPVSVEWVEV